MNINEESDRNVQFKLHEEIKEEEDDDKSEQETPYPNMFNLNQYQKQ